MPIPQPPISTMFAVPKIRPVVAALGNGVIAFFCVLSSPVEADEIDPLSFFLSESLVRDSNLFRLPSAVDPVQIGLPAGGRSDRVRVDTVAVKLNKMYSLQRFSANASLANYHFSRFHFLDYRSENADGRWDWAVTPMLNGTIEAGRKQTLTNFADYQTYVRNIRTTDQFRVSAELGVRGPWHMLAAAKETKATDSVPQLQTWNARTRAVEGGVKYVSAAGNSLSYLLRRNEVAWLDRPLDFLGQYDNQARQTDHELALDLRSGAKVQAKASLIRLQRRHDVMSVRDYSGTAGRVELGWQPTAALEFDLQAHREYGSWWDATASYLVTDRWILAPVWQISPKFVLRGRVEQADREFRGSPQSMVGSIRHDITRSGLLALDWSPWRAVSLSVSWQLDRRHSTLPGLDYQNATTGVAAQLKF